MKSFISDMMSEGGKISSNRVNGTLCLLFFFLVVMADITLRATIKFQMPEMIYVYISGLIISFFGLKSLDKSTIAKNNQQQP